MKTMRIFLAIILLVLSYQTANARIINVPADSSTIQKGIIGANDGDTVLVDRGTYYENIDFLGKNILVASNYIFDRLQATVDSTIINGGGLGRVVKMQSVNGANTGIIGFTLTNGYAVHGGGVYCYLSSARISHNVITGDTADQYGGGIWVWNSSPTIDSNQIFNNKAYSGGGISSGNSSCEYMIIGNLIRRNHASEGGGLYIEDYCSLLVQNNTIDSNMVVYYGGGIYCAGGSSPNITENDLVANNASAEGGGISCVSSSPTIERNTIRQNESGDYGGGIIVYKSHAKIAWNLIVHNKCNAFGGGICSYADTSSISNNTIDANSANWGNAGGGIHCEYSAAGIWNNIITNSLDGWGVSCFPSSNPHIFHNDVWDNYDGNFYGCPPGVGDTSWGENFNKTPCDSFYNIIVEPLFDPESTNYALLCSSECIDAGDTDFPPLAVGGAKIDQGAFEYPYILGDANGDGVIDQGDIVNLINCCYLGSICPCPWRAGDANCDGELCSGDIVKLIGYVFRGESPPDCEDCKSGRMKTKISFQSLKATRDLSWVGFAPPVKLSDGLIELSVTGAFDSEVIAVDLEIECDPDEIELLNLELADMTKNLQIYHGFKDKALRIGILDMYGKHSIAPGQGTLVTLRLRGTDLSSLKISNATLVGGNAEKIPVQIVSEVKNPVRDFTARKPAIPEEFSLSQNYPNPFNPETEISYDLPEDSRVRLSIYNIRGQKVKTLVDAFEAAGHKTVQWNATDGDGKKMASGIYFYRIQADEFTDTKKMILMK